MFKLFESGYLKLSSALSKLVNSSMRIEVAHDLSANEVAAVEQRLYEFSREATGACDGRNLGFIIRDETGDVVGAALSYTWAGIAELRQLWVAEGCRAAGWGAHC
jgi:hypothetical protein